MRKAKRKRESSKCQKCKTHVRETAERHQPPQEDEFSLNGDSDLDDQIEKLVDTAHIANAKKVAMKRVKREVIRMTLKKILKTTSISRNKQGNP